MKLYFNDQSDFVIKLKIREIIQMKKYIILLNILLFFSCIAGKDSNKSDAPFFLRVDYLKSNLVVNKDKPLLSWKVPATINNQASYQVEVKDLYGNNETVWLSEWMNSDNSYVLYGGKKLNDNTYYQWRVRVKNEAGKTSEWSNFTQFSTSFVGSNAMSGAQLIVHPDKSKRSPAFKKTISIIKTVEYAKVYLASFGWVNLKVNDTELSNQFMSPVASAYEKRLLYTGRDITKFLKKGNNNLYFQVTEGFGAFSIPDSTRFYNARKTQGVERPALIASVFIRYTDGSSERIGSDTSWAVNKGGLLYSNLYGGEDVDLRTGINNSDWTKPNLLDYHGLLSPNKLPLNKVHSTLTSIKSISPTSKSHIYDMGTIVVGYWKVKVKGKAGDTITIRGSEKLAGEDFQGQLNDSSRLDFSAHHSNNYYFKDKKTIYILKGKGIETLEPSFFLHGFRYIQIDLSNEETQILEVEGQKVNHDYPMESTFTCSNSYLNKLYKNATGTFFGLVNQFPLSNPHSEIFPWTGDVTCFYNAMNGMSDFSSFWIKWLRDIKDSQFDNGAIPETTPNYRDKYYASEPSWGQEYINLLYRTYHSTGDTALLTEFAESVKRQLDYYETARKGKAVKGTWGDHNQPKAFGELGKRGKTPELLPLMSTAVYHKMLLDFIKIAKELNKPLWVKAYSKRADEVKTFFNTTYWNDGLKMYWVDKQVDGYDNTQTIHSMALQCGLVPNARQEHVYEVLLENLTQKHDYKVTTGIHGTRALFDVLDQKENSEVLYRVVMDERYPGWKYQIDKGATSLWQSFSGKAGLTHGMFGGGPIDFVQRHLLGIRAEKVGSSKKIEIRPFIPDDMTYAEGKLSCYAGDIKVSWRKDGKKVVFEMEIPGNIEANFNYQNKNQNLHFGFNSITIE